MDRIILLLLYHLVSETDDTDQFIEACKNGNLDMIKWILEVSDIDFNKYGNEGFMTACLNNHYQIVKLMLDHYRDIDIHYNNEESFIKTECNSVITILIKYSNYTDTRLRYHNGVKYIINTDSSVPSYIYTCIYGINIYSSGIPDIDMVKKYIYGIPKY
jgi:ankyrin repeat protein